MQIGLQTRTNNMTMDDKSDVRSMPAKVLPLIQEDPRKNGKLPAQGDTSGEMDAAGGGRKPALEAPPIVTPVRPGNVAPAVPSGRPMTPPASAPVTPPALAPVTKVAPDSGHCDTDSKKQSC
jgi:hypothetical protein